MWAEGELPQRGKSGRPGASASTQGKPFAGSHKSRPFTVRMLFRIYLQIRPRRVYLHSYGSRLTTGRHKPVDFG